MRACKMGPNSLATAFMKRATSTACGFVSSDFEQQRAARLQMSSRGRDILGPRCWRLRLDRFLDAYR